MDSITNNRTKYCTVIGCNRLGQIARNGKRYFIKGMCGSHYRADYRSKLPKIINNNVPKISHYPKKIRRLSPEGKPYCTKDNDNCMNLARQRGRGSNGVMRYRTECERHGRKGRRSKQFNNPNSVHYAPLVQCAWCDNKAEHRHRIVREIGYYSANILTLCKECHYNAHHPYIAI